MANEAHDRQPLLFRHVEKSPAVLLRQGLADRLQVVARIKPVGNCDLFAQRLAVAQECRARQNVHLAAGIVDVILARDVIAREGKKVRERVAEHGAATMPDVHRSGRIRRHVLDVELAAVAPRACTILHTALQDGAHQIVPDAGLERDVQKPRPRDLDLGDIGIAFELLLERFGNIARFHFRGLRQHQRRVDGDIAVGRIARRLGFELRQR